MKLKTLLFLVLTLFVSTALHAYEIYTNESSLLSHKWSGSDYSAQAITYSGGWFGEPMDNNNPNYNKIVGTPEKDGNGRNWYDVDYTCSWSEMNAPFDNWFSYDDVGDFYARRTFIFNGELPTKLYLACGHDDSPCEYYLNGVLIWREIDGSWFETEIYKLTSEQISLLRPGEENVLAFHVHQNWGGMYADCGLYNNLTELVSDNKCGNNLTWSFDDSTETLTISGEGQMYNYDWSAPWVHFASAIKQVVIQPGVTRIGNTAFYRCKNLESVTIPSSVTSIGSNAFRGTGLTSIDIPNSVTSIGEGAFYGCTGLTSINIPNSVTSIGGSAFRETGLTSIVIPNSVTSIGGEAFAGCSNLSSLSIDCSTIEGWFSGNTSITELVIGENVTIIGDWAFFGCSGLISVTIPSNVMKIGDTAFCECRGLTSIPIPNSVTSIGWDAFNRCTSLTSVTIGSGVTSIGGYAFDGCNKLESLFINCSTIESWFSGNTSLTELIIGDNVTIIGDNAFDQCVGLTSVTIPNSVTNIGGDAFRGCGNLKSLSIDCSTIGDWFGNTSLTELIIGDNVTSIGRGAFAGCKGLTSINIPNSVISIGEGAFYGCTGLTSINIPNSVTSIGGSAFRETGLTSIVIPNSVTSIGGEAFAGCSNLSSLSIDCSTIQDWFSSNSSLTELIIGDNVTFIGERAFYRCTGLSSLTIGSSLTRIGNEAFYRCEKLNSIIIPEKVTTIGDRAFYSCLKMTSVVLPDTMSWIGEEAFRSCSDLTSVVIPSGIKSICNRTFYGCSSLASVVIPDSLTSIGDEAFRNCSSLDSIAIPYTVSSIGYAAFEGCRGLVSVSFAHNNGIPYDGYDVTANISTYSKRTHRYVWDTTQYGWYVLNDQNQYEPYGVLGTDMETTYEGKLVVVDGHEWEYNGEEWIDLGQAVKTQKAAYVGKLSEAGFSHIDLGLPFTEDTRVQMRFFPIQGGGGSMLDDGRLADWTTWRIFFSDHLFYDFDDSRHESSEGTGNMYEWEIGNYYIKDIGSTSQNYIINATPRTDFSNRGGNMVLNDGDRDLTRFYYLKVFEGNELVGDFVPYYDGSAYGLWDNVTNSAYMPTGNGWDGELEDTFVCPKDYPEKSKPFVASLLINERAFSGCSKLQSVEIPENTTIRNEAFQGCNGLKSVTFHCSEVKSWFAGLASITEINLGDEVTIIGNDAFRDCTGLTAITIGNSVKHIGDWAFYGCSSLAYVSIDSPTIGNWFSGNPSIREVTFGNSITAIGDWAFRDCTGLVSVNIPNNVKTIGEGAFYNTRITSLTIGAGVYTIGWAAFDYDYDWDNNISYGARPIKVIWLTNTPPENYPGAEGSVNYVSNERYPLLNNKTIYPYLSSMFNVNGIKYVPVSPSERTCDAIDSYYNNSVEHINIDSTVSYRNIALTVKSLCSYVCYKNTFVKDAVLNYNGSIGESAFYGCAELNKLSIGDDINAIGVKAFSNCGSLDSISVASENPLLDSRDECNAIIKTASNTLLVGCNKTVIPEEVLAIEQYAFCGCTGLTSIVIPDSVRTIGISAFSYCTKLPEIAIPNSVLSLGRSAFEKCTSLTTIVLSDKLKELAKKTFYGCNKLASIEIPDDIVSIKDSVFTDCSSIASITIPKRVASIGNYVFRGCTGLKNVDMEEDASEITLGSNNEKPLFVDCPLDSVFIGRNITYPTNSERGYSPFYRNTSLRSIRITDIETEISTNEFYGCTGLKNVLLGDGITTIGDWAFSGCSSLDYFQFGKSVETIGVEAFSDCTAMTKLISSTDIPPVCGENALDDINKWDCTLLVPFGYVEAYQAAPQWKEFFFIDIDIDAIEEVNADENMAEVSRYDAQGCLISEPQKGINIIRYSDGTSKKVLVK